MQLVSTSPEGELSEMTPATRTGPRRMLFIDNICWTMILLVLSMHATDTYSPFTQYFLSQSWGTGGFADEWFLHLRDGQALSETGPM
jgi:hypothetical protein